MTFQTTRRTTQIITLVVLCAIPIFDIFRFDVSNLELYLFRQLWSFAPRGDYISGAGGDAVSFVFKAVLPAWFLLLSVPLWGLVLGRLACGWFCPMGAMLEAGDFFNRNIKRIVKGGGLNMIRGLLTIQLLVVCLLAIGLFLAAYFIRPSEILRQVSTLKFTPFLLAATFANAAVIFIAYTFLRRLFCSYICLGAIFQMLPAVASPISFRVRFDRKRAKLCTNCKACETECFMGIRPRTMKKVDPACVACGNCITACTEELGKKDKLFDYGFGKIKWITKKNNGK
jgi:ferredoxin-type protein NapH